MVPDWDMHRSYRGGYAHLTFKQRRAAHRGCGTKGVPAAGVSEASEMLLLVVVFVLLLVVGFQLIRGLFFRGGMGMGGWGRPWFGGWFGGWGRGDGWGGPGMRA